MSYTYKAWGPSNKHNHNVEDPHCKEEKVKRRKRLRTSSASFSALWKIEYKVRDREKETRKKKPHS